MPHEPRGGHDMAEADGRTPDAQTPVSDLLLTWGADTLTRDCPPEAIQAVLEQAAKGLNGQSDLTHALVRDGLIKTPSMVFLTFTRGGGEADAERKPS